MRKLLFIFCLLTTMLLQAQTPQQQHLNIGTNPDDHTGDPLRTAMQKIETNMNYLFLHQSPRVLRDQYERDSLRGRFDGMIVWLTQPDELYQLAGDTTNAAWTQMPNYINDPTQYGFVDATYVTQAISGLVNATYVTQAISGLVNATYVTQAISNAISSLASQTWTTNAISTAIAEHDIERSGHANLEKDDPYTYTFLTALPNNDWKINLTAFDEYGTEQPVILISKTALGFQVVTMVNTTLYLTKNN